MNAAPVESMSLSLCASIQVNVKGGVSGNFID